MPAQITLKTAKDKPLRNHHPWIFSGAIARVQDTSDGDTVDVLDAAGQWLARATFNSRSQIAARVWTFDRAEQVDAEFFKRRILNAVQLRESLAWYNSPQTSVALRLVNAESDSLPGLIVDRYGDYLVTQFLTLGAELHKQEIITALRDLFSTGASLAPNSFLTSVHRPPSSDVFSHPSSLIPQRSLRGIYNRSDVDVRKKEGLPETTGVLWGDEPPDRVEIVENDLHFFVDVKRGHKTGFYLDQHENRQRSAPYLRGNVLNAFAYTGAFGIYAAKQNAAHVTNLDASAASLELCAANFELNEVAANAEYVTADAFQKLREYRTASQRFDAIILDPPKFVTSAANKDRALRGYKDLNLLAFQLLNPGGYLITFSCSGLVDPYLFQQVIFGAAVDAHRDAQIIEKLGQSPDHPIGLNFPESEYLKGLILRVN